MAVVLVSVVAVSVLAVPVVAVSVLAVSVLAVLVVAAVFCVVDELELELELSSPPRSILPLALPRQ